jgi:hypothetical protein
MDKINMINLMCFAENKSIDHSTTAPTSSAKQKISASRRKQQTDTLRTEWHQWLR